MDAFRSSLLRTADDISLAIQNAGKIFGFLADGRDLVIISDHEGGLPRSLKRGMARGPRWAPGRRQVRIRGQRTADPSGEVESRGP